MAKKKMLGLPWWLWVGAGAAVIYFVTCKKAQAWTPPPVLPPGGTPVPQVVDPEEPPMNEYVATQMNGCVGCL